jgi:hypothetical protein
MTTFRVDTVFGLTLLSAWSLLLISCPTGTFSPEDDDESLGDPIPVETVLFEEDPDTGAVTAKTNDADELTAKGRSLWHMGSVTQEPHDEYSVTMYKLSGRSETGYGMTFAMQDIDNFLVVMITTQGFYVMGRVEERNFTELTADGRWAYTPQLLQGYNRPNTLTVTFDPGDNEYTLAINGAEVETFVDNSDDPYTGGGMGHIVTLSPFEVFPELPVHVVFEPVTPADIGVMPSMRAVSAQAQRGEANEAFAIE